MLNEDGNPRYCYLSKLALTILLLPHGNADPERGFSVNKKILEKHGDNIDEDTSESVRTVKDFLIQSGGQSGIEVKKEMRTVKDFLIQSGGQSGIEVQKQMIQQCKSSRSKYQKYLEEKRAQKKEEEKQKQNEV